MTARELFDISGRVALVTGGSIGLGRQMAEGLAEFGCNVAVANRNVQMGRAAATALQDNHGVSALAVEMDVTDRSSVGEAVRQAMDHFGQIDILVNCAGISGETALSLTEENSSAFRRILDVNVTGIYQCTAAVAPSMIRRGSGRVINVASIYGENGVDRALYVDDLESEFALHGYAASKGAVCNLTRDLAASLGRHNVTVNAILPATFITDQNRHLFQGEVLARIQRRTPLGRVGTDDDLKGVVVFLASDASKYVTGQMLAVDGGWLAW